MKIEHLPDITNEQNLDTPSALRWVGMDNIAVPITRCDFIGDGKIDKASADVAVSLDDPTAKGIHMSRIYSLTQHAFIENTLSFDHLEQLLTQLWQSQKGLSFGAKLNLRFDLLMAKSALLSGQLGFQTYPVALGCEMAYDQTHFILSLTLPYSSTCPCSASLSRQALAAAFREQFDNAEQLNLDAVATWLSAKEASVATPHSQRSYAYLTLKLQQHAKVNLVELIHYFENALSTPVQTAVKRSDEQEFAKLNAQNLMFCEDAAKRIKQAIKQHSAFAGYWFKVEHQESLHAHNAVVVDFSDAALGHYQQKQ